MELPNLLASLGPRAFMRELATPEICRVIAKSTALGYFKTALLGMAQNEQAELFDEIAEISRRNRLIENTAEFKAANGFGYPSHRIPLGMWMRFEDIYGEGCWGDPEFVEDTLRHHPGLRIKVTRGTRGQEYGGTWGHKSEIRNPKSETISEARVRMELQRHSLDGSRSEAGQANGAAETGSPIISEARVRDGAAEIVPDAFGDAELPQADGMGNGELGEQTGHENAASASENIEPSVIEDRTAPGGDTGPTTVSENISAGDKGPDRLEACLPSQAGCLTSDNAAGDPAIDDPIPEGGA
jgi:hypothetical protein